ncbi:chromate transporter [Salipaludibacillus aurantiacus]|uniref:chromate transporter n=1 Tax=Salipaludibacillus aurantiacus TaxID=1601833 RepID=UPI000B87BC46|nr:chromate transporter [Salipaludibacillus aurantiacus]
MWQLFAGFFRAGILGYGGGPASIPLVRREAVITYKWMNDEEFSDLLALGNTLPGPIITKMAGYIGYRVYGTSGLLVALFATVMPTVFIMIILVTTLSNAQDIAWVNGMTKAVIPVVGVMLVMLAYSFFRQSTLSNGVLQTIILILISLLVIVVMNIHPAVIIGTLILFALMKK